MWVRIEEELEAHTSNSVGLRQELSALIAAYAERDTSQPTVGTSRLVHGRHHFC